MIKVIVRNKFNDYGLRGWKDIPSFNDVVQSLIETENIPDNETLHNEEERREWERQISQLIYSKINLNKAVEVDGNDPSLKHTLYIVKRRNAERLWAKNPKAPLDIDMRTWDNETFAYKMSKSMAAETVEQDRTQIKETNSFTELDTIALASCEERLPNTYPYFIERLSINDTCFWNEFGRYLLHITETIVRRTMSGYRRLAPNKDEIQSYINANITYVLHQELVESDITTKVNDASHFRNHIWMICKNKFLEISGKHIKDINKKEEYTEQDFAGISNTDPLPTPKDDDFIYNIDPESIYDITIAIGFILRNPSSRWYPKLTEIEEEIYIDIFKSKFLDGDSYDKIVEAKFPQQFRENKKRISEAVRQRMTRLKPKLTNRMKELVTKL